MRIGIDEILIGDQVITAIHLDSRYEALVMGTRCA